MSWLTVTKKLKIDNTSIKKKYKKSKKIKNDDEKNLIKGYCKPTGEENFDYYEGSELFDLIIDSYDNCRKYNRDLFRNTNSADIYFFLKQFIPMEQFEENSDSESDDDFLEDY